MWLGLDLGTSSAKAVLVDDAGLLVAEASAPIAISRPQPGWSEQDPSAWWDAACQAIATLPARERAAVRGIGLSGQMHGATLLDAGDQPLRPAMLWNDGRAEAECRALEIAEPRTRAITGNRAMPGFTAPKLLWVKRHEPDLFGRTATVLLPKDYLRLMLTGDRVSDPSDASGTLWLDVAARHWSAEMLAATHLDVGQMPALAEGSAPTGMLRPVVAEQLGIPVVPVAAGGGDNAAGALGIGASEPGQGFVSLGTSGVIFVVSDGFRPNPADAVHAFCHALPNRWHQMAVTLSAASAVNWAAHLGGFPDAASAVAASQARDLFAPRPIFLPYLSGERTPHDDAAARGVLFGLDADHDGAILVLSVLEGVAFALADGADALRAAGTRLDRLGLIGGGSRSHLWARLIASACGLTLERLDGGDVGPALGAALLGRLAVTGEPIEQVRPAGTVLGEVAPEPALVDALSTRRRLFRSIYQDLRPRFRELATC